jgi:glycosyl transferase family 25
MNLLTAIRIISMENSLQRRADFSQYAPNSGLEWQFFSAHQSVVLPLEYHPHMAQRRFGRALSSSELGCYTSHFKCWEWLAGSEYEQAIIFEDDVMVDWSVIRELSECSLSHYGIDFLRLFTTHPTHWKIIKFRFLSPHYHLIRTVGICFGSQGYVLTKSGARNLLSRYSQIESPIDWVLTRYWEHKLVNYCLFPFPVIEQHVSSTIGEGRNTIDTLSYLDRLIRIYWRTQDKLRCKLFDVIHKRWPLGRTVDTGKAFLARSD